jgi:hypothetical protein
MAYAHEKAIYWRAFNRLWTFIITRQIDRRRGGRYPVLGASFGPQGRIKSDGWAECYHQARR